jgi:hypothetical protein
LNQVQKRLGGGHIGQVILAVGGRQFQLVTICRQLTAFLAQPLFQLGPAFARGGWIRLLG